MAHIRNIDIAGGGGAGAPRIDLDLFSSVPARHEARLMLRIGEVKERLIEAWRRAVPALAPSGHVTADDAGEIGVGTAVYAAMAVRCGKTACEAMSHAEFLGLVPLLIEYWPVTDEGLVALEELLRETEDAAASRAG